MDIRGRGAVVTGGSQGLGKALAIALAKRGARVVVTARGEEAIERVAEEIRNSGGAAHAIAGDVADKQFVHPLAASAAALIGDVDILIHNASTLGPVPMPLLLDTECEDFSAVLETNVIGPLRLTRRIAANMALRKRGVVVFISSDAATSAYPNWGAYGVSKAALDHLARSFAAELADSGVRFFFRRPRRDEHEDARRRIAGCRRRDARRSERRRGNHFADDRKRRSRGKRRAVARGEMEPKMTASMNLAPATWPRGNVSSEKLLVIDAAENRVQDAKIGDLAQLLAPGDLIVVNDAATFPASLRGRTRSGELVEARLVEAPLQRKARAVLFGAGDWQTKTEDRKAPPAMKADDEIFFDGLSATIVRVDGSSARLVELVFDREGARLWKGLFSAGKPVQYAYIDHELALWDVQTPFASRPFAAEMPSAGRPISWSTLQSLTLRGVGIARLSHAAGISSTGDAALDARLPFSERFSIPAETVAAVLAARKSSARVVAIGTTVVRALEGSFAANAALCAGDGETDWLGGPNVPLHVVDAIFSGMHEPEPVISPYSKRSPRVRC